MSTHDPLDQPDPRIESALSRLVTAGTISPTQAEAVRRAVAEESAQALPRPAPSERGRAHGLAEIAGYAGGALVAAAAALFVAELWHDLSDTTRALWLGGTGAVLLLAAFLLATRAGEGARALRSTDTDAPAARRRLVGTLVALAACSAAGAAGVAATGGESAWAGLAGLAVASAGWALVPTAVGALSTWAASLLLTGGLLEVAGVDDSLAPGLAFLGVGLLWAAAALIGMPRERVLALALGAATALAGAQVTGFENTPVQYATTAALSLAGFVLYARIGAWPLVALGVVGVTLAVPEAVADWTDGDLGAAGGVLVSGVALLAASALGLRLRQTRAYS